MLFRQARIALLALAAALVPIAVDGGHIRDASAQAKAPAPGWLGIAMEKSKGAPGVVVAHVIKHSPAASAGLLDGDRIVKIDGTPVAMPSDISAKVSGKGAGQSLAVQLVRGNATSSYTVTLVPRPSADQIFRMELVGEKLPNLPALKLASGPGPVAYPGLAGRVVLVDLFATWCGPCMQLGPYYGQFHTKYASQGLTVLAISAEDPVLLAGFATKNSIPYSLASDPSDSLAQKLAAPAIPASVLVDKHGVVRDVAVGFEVGQVKRTEQLIQALLKEP
ncbi:MAG: redoxin family protein [Polyangiales bacterium]